MNIEIKAIDDLIYEVEMFEQAGVYPVQDFIDNLKNLAAKVKEETKLEGCVVVPESEYNNMAQFKDLYKRAIVNAKKRKDQLNWAHVAGLGVGSTKAIELLKEFGIDPSKTTMHTMVEAARGGNHE